MRRICIFFCKHKLLITVIIEFIVIVVLYFLGFRITYNAKIEKDWNAIEACGTWFCGCIVPIAVIIIQHKISESEQRTSASNIALLDEIEQIKKILIMKNYKDSLNEKYLLMKYIGLSV